MDIISTNLDTQLDTVSERHELIETLISEFDSEFNCFPLSFAQERLWFVHQLTPDSSTYNISAAVQLTGSLHVTALHQSLNEIVQRHEALRTIVAPVGGQPMQIVLPFSPVQLPLVDLRTLPPSQQSEEVRRLAIVEAHHPFDLTQAPLFRIILLQLGETEHVLLLTMHHIISDGWSIGVLLRELTALYKAYLEENPTPLPDLSIQYADFAAWQREWLQAEVLETHLSYWQQQLGGLSVLELPTDRPRPAVQSFRGAHHSLLLSPSLVNALKALSYQEESTLFMTLLAAFQVLLHRYSGQDDISVGTPIANRMPVETEALIGCFVNTLVLRTDLADRPSFRQLLRRVRQVALDAYTYQDLPFEQLVAAVQSERDLSLHPLFQVAFALQNAPLPPLELPGLTLRRLEVENHTAKFDLMLELWETSAGLQGWLEYNTDLFDAATIARLSDHFQTLLAGIVAHPDQQISELPLLTAAEHQQFLVWNQTQVQYPQTLCLHHLVEAQVQRTPDAVAVVFEDQQLTYQELNARANQLAHYLQTLAVAPNVLVGVCLERSIDMVIALLGILKAGGAYVPLDPAYPKERLAFMLEDADVSLLLTHRQLLESLPSPQPRYICLDNNWDAIRTHSPHNLDHRISPDSLAYVIYTSGSTGRPKGVMNTHAGIVNRLLWMQDAYCLTADDRVLQKTPFSFDVSVWEFFWSLSTGAQLVVAQPGGHQDSRYLVNLIVSAQITTLHFVPSMLQVFLQEPDLERCRSLRRIICSGEALTVDLQQRSLSRLRAELHNLYGPTEAAIDVTFWHCQRQDQRQDQHQNQRQSVPIGRPIANTQIYLLDAAGQPVPVGVAGELHIGGIGLARGYLKRPDLTAEKFVPNPFNDEPGTCLYKTGDLARYLPNGEIEYIGRIDHQVKLRGFRIELGEIEAVLSQHPVVAEAVVVTGADQTGDQRLVAYVVSHRVISQDAISLYGASPDGVSPTNTPIAPRELRSFLQNQLPHYMVPTVFVWLEHLPLTPNGKVDRNALPAPELAPLTPSPDANQTSTPIEEMLMGIWATVLKLDRVGIHDNFFELGGHSLLVTQVISQVRQIFQVELPLRCLFEFPTIAEFAPVIEAATQTGSGLEAPPIQPYPRSEAVPLSFAQQRLWFLNQLMPETSAYNIPAAVRLQGQLDVSALEQSLNQVVQRHESLRTTFVTVDQQPVQWIHAAQMESALTLPVPLLDLRQFPESDRADQIWPLAAESAQEPFDLTGGPLLRAKLLQLADEEYVLLLTMHHIISDGWSFGVLVQELALFYEALSSQKPELLPELLPELPIQYADFALWQRQWLQGDVLETQLSYWKQQLGGNLPVLALPTDRPRPAVLSFQGARRSFQLSESLSQELKRLSQQRGVTLFMTLLAAFNVLLQRYCAQDEIVVGSPIANRNRAEIEPLIGLFANTLVLRTDLSGDPTFEDLLQRVREMALAAYAHQDLPFEKLVEALRPERDLGHAPLFQVLFVLQNTPMPVLQLPGLTLSPLEVETRTAKFDLSLSLRETEAELLGSLEYNSELFEPATIDRLVGHWQTLLESIVANPQQHLSQLPLLSQRDRQQMLVEWNATDRTDVDAACLHELFEQQVEQSPDAIAIVFEQQQLTYQQLNRRANQLAHHLRRLGVGPEVLVGICVERSIEMIVGVLGILKAGGGYVPLDPAYPIDRLAFMLTDAQIKVLLTEQSQLERLPAIPAKVVCLDDGAILAQESKENLCSSGVSTENLAYVIYTSGSTGRPKGVMVSHRAICNHLLWRQMAYPLTETDRFLQKASLGFDISVWEIFAPLLAGAQLILARPGGQQDIAYLVHLIAAQQITTVHLIPSLLQLFLEHSELATCNSLKRIFCGGERLSLQLQERFFNRLETNHLIALHHQYGPTEASVDVTCWDCQPQINQTTVPIGRPITNTQIYLLDRHLQPVPIGVPGELYIGGASLSWGYLNRPDLTAEKFIPHPFSDRPGSRLYQSGDLARYLPDGSLEYLGRIDQQIKLRGFRIEPGEIETVLAQHPAVQECAVLAREDTPGDIRLVSYVGVAKEKGIEQGNIEQGGTEQSPAVVQELHELKGELRSYLREKLPHYMIPSACVLLEALPLTPSGKIDRRALPEPKRTGSRLPTAGRAPRTEIERAIATVWQEVLDMEKVGIHDNFFDLGGHSLLMVQIQSKLEQVCQKEVQLVDLFQYPTISSLAEYFNQNQGKPNQNQDKQLTYQKAYDRVTERKKSRERHQQRKQKQQFN